MSLSDFIERLQNKPRPVKILIMWAGVGICMVGFFVLWITNLNINFRDQKIAEQKNIEQSDSFLELKKEMPSLWQSLTAGIGDLFGSENKEPENQSGQQDNLPASDRKSINPTAPEKVPSSELP
jgi:hypothetical protein